MDATGGLLPSDFITFIKVAAALGFFSAIALIVAIEYKGFKKVLGEEIAKKYMWVFIVGNVTLLFVVIFIFLVIFRGAKLQFGN